MLHILYECGICDHLHPWNWRGDCRDNENRYAGVGDYCYRKGVFEYQVQVRSMDERVQADEEGQ